MEPSMSDSISGARSPRQLSWDTILFIGLWAALFWSSELSGLIIPTNQFDTTLIAHLTRVLDFAPLSAFMVMTLLAYIVADMVLTDHWQFVLKLAAVWVTILAFVVMPTVAAILYRHNSAPYLYIHDGAIQIEEAVKFLLAGKNPYAENYTATPMAQWAFHEPGLDVNPGLYHLVYLPRLVLISVPFYLFSQATLGWFDQRFVYLLMLFALTLMLLGASRAPRERLSALMVVTLNPLFVPFFIEGRNDVVVLFWLVGAILFLQRNKIGWAGIFLACAAASKQTAWFLVPFFLLYLLKGTIVSQWRMLLARVQPLVPGALLLVVTLLPFFLWNPAAFVDDTINYQSGLSSAGTTTYPIKSLGLGDLALGLGWIKSSTDTFPFSIFQIVLGGLTLILLLWLQWRHNTIAQMALNYAILFFVFAFFSRTFNDNHLGFALTCFILPSFLADANPSS
jgi:hypothetical protein